MYRILLIALVVLAVPSTKVTLSIPLQPGPEPELIAVVTFDTDRVSATDVKRWMLLHESSYYDTSVFGYYPECKPSDVPKLEKDIKKTQQIVDDLDVGGEHNQADQATELADRLVGAAQERRNLLHPGATVRAEKMRCGSANFTDTAALGRGLKRGERDARKLRKGDQYFGCGISATRTHRYAVYDPRASALIA